MQDTKMLGMERAGELIMESQKSEAEVKCNKIVKLHLIRSG